ncbi:hypothetical protein BDV37DRAFT_277287 [Aspergillus pseudonomiae]|uniref:Cyanovirin-N domain-containing protein n=1 Tax=Aspergillus pseudonomiae TaxID=1506151 RepID=A0A5N7CRX8_9EURO|nr:uncharacterized protein BDV37DRAFT_277287 [Aspergillus pseudonomiae]KAE8396946.1 hypothetical protein BDV37DRAFT_277287 [Aspergillus pseudonomiae]
MQYKAFTIALLGLGKSYAAHFSQTCSSLDLQGSLLVAKCSGSPNKYYDTVVDLNKCVGNRDGTLMRGCMCYGRKGVMAPSSILNLDEFVTNEGGVLVCDKED